MLRTVTLVHSISLTAKPSTRQSEDQFRLRVVCGSADLLRVFGLT